MRTPSVPSALRRVAVGVALLLAAGLAGFGGSALAGGGGQTFSDVNASHPFYDEIEWLADTGITTGYPDGTFRPGAPVTRQAMAAYLQRAFDGITIHMNTSIQPESTGSWELDAQCPIGKQAIAGGGYANTLDVFMTDSAPAAFGTGWRVRFETDDNLQLPDVAVSAFATCIPETP